MNQENLFEPIPAEKFDLLSREDLVEWAKVQQRANENLLREVERLRALHKVLEQSTLLVEDQYIVLKGKYFGKSSEKSPKEDTDDEKTKKVAKTRVQLPSLRYPDAPLIEQDVELKTLPTCKCCGTKMADSGMTEDSEFLTVIPKQYIVVRQKRHKYRCGKCHGDVKTAPSPPKIKQGSSLSDEMIQDVSLTKYCDLIPIQRYVAIADRSGIKDLPPQSLIEATHNLADFVKPVHELLKKEVTESKVLHADETPHRMLEGDEKSNWYLWGFSSKKASYFECHDTRSGDVASELLSKSVCEFLVSDVFSGYGKSVRDTNEIRRNSNLPLVKNVYCNAHARRKFKEAKDSFESLAKTFTDFYKKIYHLESEVKSKPPDEILAARTKMRPIFLAMKTETFANVGAYSSKSSIGKAMSYFLGNYNELTLFLDHPDLPIDNNQQERLLRNPVIGRKTWYGTHSRRGAETAAMLFSLIESCKLNQINPRQYFIQLVKDLHRGKPPYTPSQSKNH